MSGNAFPPRPHLTTPRLTLNALTPADCGDYAALCRDVRRNRWWGYDYREEQPHPPEEWFLQASEEDYAAGRELGLAVRLRGRCIGEVVFTHFDGHGTAELGCRIAAAYAGHGYGTEAFAAALAKAKAEGRESVHVRAWLPIPAECLAQSEIELQSFTEHPGRIADANAPQRTVCWEADLTENRRFGVQYRYKTTAVYADPLDFVPAPEQPTFDTEEQAPHIVFTPYLRALAAQLTEGITDPAEKAKRIYDYVTLNVRYHYQPAYFVQECLPDHCARDRRGDCGIMALTFITLCRLVVSPTGVGCHDWAMFYIAPKGWMYADCSFGASMARKGEEELRRHYFGSLDTGRMVANRAFEAPFDPPMYGFRSDPYDNQSGECEVDGVGLYGDALDTRKELVDFEDL